MWYVPRLVGRGAAQAGGSGGAVSLDRLSGVGAKPCMACRRAAGVQAGKRAAAALALAVAVADWQGRDRCTLAAACSDITAVAGAASWLVWPSA